MELGVVELDGLEVWRVGRRPNPWAWVPWEAAREGTFGGRWDDPNGRFRTMYAGSSLLGCLLEVLAGFRIDPTVASALADIDEDTDDRSAYPTAAAGEVDPQWLETRLASRGALHGTFCRISDSQTVAALHPRFAGLAKDQGLPDFDAAAIKDGRARGLTQALAGFLHESTEHDGIQFASRHGDDQTLWAIFERGDVTASPRCVDNQSPHELTRDHPAITEAFAMLGLRWGAASRAARSPADPIVAVVHRIERFRDLELVGRSARSIKNDVVIVDFGDVDASDAARVIDFCAGLAQGLGRTVEPLAPLAVCLKVPPDNPDRSARIDALAILELERMRQGRERRD